MRSAAERISHVNGGAHQSGLQAFSFKEERVENPILALFFTGRAQTLAQFPRENVSRLAKTKRVSGFLWVNAHLFKIDKNARNTKLWGRERDSL